jgi:hypothetical protein
VKPETAAQPPSLPPQITEFQPGICRTTWVATLYSFYSLNCDAPVNKTKTKCSTSYGPRISYYTSFVHYVDKIKYEWMAPWNWFMPSTGMNHLRSPTLLKRKNFRDDQTLDPPRPILSLHKIFQHYTKLSKQKS